MRRSAFTLVELLAVVGIIALLIAILLPVLSKARQAAASVKASSDLRQLLTGYLQYSIDNKGALLLGYPPLTVNGVPVVAELTDGTLVGPPTSQRYPWRLIRHVSNVWPIMYYYGSVPDDDYVKGLSTGFGLNDVFLGGHDGPFFRGFNGDRPNTGKHVAFKASEIRRSSRQIVFTEAKRTIAGEHDGAFYVQPPRGNAPGPDDRWWVASPDGKTAIAKTSVFGGLPNGRFGNGTLVGFFDGHTEALTPRELEDMRLWCPRATSADYDFTP
ncbi:MAG: type II secretion system protein [Tepidisphaeraceae bacterium]